MPRSNHFRHQSYPTTQPDFRLVSDFACLQPEAGSFRDALRELRIGRILLISGTFVGDDPIGLADIVTSLTRNAPELIRRSAEAVAAGLKRKASRWTPALTRDIANFTDECTNLLQELCGPDVEVCQLDPPWSSQNHHLARADLAARLLEEFSLRPPSESDRTMVWGHSHAGNGMALASNLLASSEDVSERFFEACDQPSGSHWESARAMCRSRHEPHPAARGLVFVTFGTPVRYGWDPDGVADLIHITYHRNAPSEQPERTQPLFPMHSLPAMIAARDGDWVQAFAIAGTDVSTPHRIQTNQRLTELLETGLEVPEIPPELRLLPSERLRHACVRWKAGTRCHADGINLLTDYRYSGRKTPLQLPLEHAVFGHGAATTTTWLPAHLDLVCRTLRSGRTTG